AEHLDDVRVADRGDGAALADEASAQLGRVAVLLAEDLDRDAAIEAGVDALQDIAHLARTDGPLDAVRAECRPRLRIRHGEILLQRVRYRRPSLPTSARRSRRSPAP